MKNPTGFVLRSAALSLLAVQLSCGGSDSSAPAVAATIAANSAIALTGSPGATVTDRPSVIVRDQSESPLGGVTVTFAVTSGGGSLTGASAVTDASGIATVGSWTLGSAIGSNTLTASTGSLPPVTFTATDPCAAAAPHTIGGTTNGELATSDCRLADGSYIDFYTTSVATEGAYLFNQASTTIDTYLALLSSGGVLIAFNDDNTTSRNSTIKALLPAASYTLAANSFEPSEIGSYTLSSASTPSTITSCEEVFVVRGVSTDQTLETTDCDISGSYSDDMLIFLRAGQEVTISMGLTAFDARLDLFDDTITPVATNDDPTSGNAQIVYTPTADGFFLIAPTSTVAGATGAYTLTIQ